MTDEEITRVLAEKVMGWKVTTNPSYAKRMVEDRQPVICDLGSETEVYAPGGGLERWRPLDRIDHAWQVRDRLAEWGVVVLRRYHRGEEIVFLPNTGWLGEKRTVQTSAATAPRAICLAALRAVGEDIPDAS